MSQLMFNYFIIINLNECATIIQMDGHLWGGPEVVKNDPYAINNTGKLFKNFLKNNPQLSVGNSLDICDGSITRSRKAGNKLGLSCAKLSSS